MRKIRGQQTISAMVALPIVLMTNSTNQAFAADTVQVVDPTNQVKVYGLGDELNFEVPGSTTITIEESENWDEPEFSATNLDKEINKFMTENFQPVIEEPPAVVYLSAARGQSTRECRISGICE